MTPTPTTQQLNDQIIADLAGSLNQSVPLLPKAFARVLARVLSAVVVLVYKYADWQLLQLLVAHASYEETTILGKRVRPLEFWGVLIGLGTRPAATRAELAITVTVLTQVGALKFGSQLVRSETGVIYEVASAVPLDAATVTARIRPIADQLGGDGSGEIGNLAVGDVLSFSNAPAEIASEAVVASVVELGADAQDVEVYRGRIIDRFRKKPQGGAYADYQLWGQEVSGVANVYPYAANIPGLIDVYVESSTEPDGIPTLEQREAVAAIIDMDIDGLATRRPVNAAVTVRSITRRTFNVLVVGLQPDSPELRAEIDGGLDEYFASREPFIEGLSVLPRDDRITQGAVSGIVDGIVNAAGATVNSVTLSTGPAYTLGRGEKAKRGTVSYA